MDAIYVEYIAYTTPIYDYQILLEIASFVFLASPGI